MYVDRDGDQMELRHRAARHKTIGVRVGGVQVGGGAPIVVQSMTNTDTADVRLDAARSASSCGRPAPRWCASP